MTIERYVLLTGTGDEEIEGDYEYDSYQEAKDDAFERHAAVICHTYVYDDSELLDDYRRAK